MLSTLFKTGSKPTEVTEMIKTTTDYSQFSMMDQNRDVDMDNRRVKNLAKSMQQYGWLDAFPMMVKKIGGKMIVIDGQHRLAVAREYGIPAKYVIENKDIDVAQLNDTSHAWTVDDFVKRYAKEGVADYVSLIAFSDHYGISVNMAAGLMNNTSSPGNVIHRVKNGTFKITSRPMATSIAECYQRLCAANKAFGKANALKVLFACFQVSYFDPDRLVNGARKRSSEIKSITKIELFFDMFEDIYNFGRKEKHPLRFDAEQAMKSRRIMQNSRHD